MFWTIKVSLQYYTISHWQQVRLYLNINIREIRDAIGSRICQNSGKKARTLGEFGYGNSLMGNLYLCHEMLDKIYFPWYNIAILANIANLEVDMTTKTIPSTEAQNNFGRILDDVIQNDTRYVIKRRNISQAILLNLPDFERLLAASENERKQMGNVIRELSPVYNLGETIEQ